MASIEPLMRRFFVLHARMQQLFNAWDRADADAATRASGAERRRRRLPAALAGQPRRSADGRRRAARAARGELRAARSVRAHVAGDRRRAASRAGARSSGAAAGDARHASLDVALCAASRDACACAFAGVRQPTCPEPATLERAHHDRRIVAAKPSDVDTAQRTRCSRASFATTSMAQSASVSA